MKKIIIILGTILLGVWIVSSLIMSDTGMKGKAEKIQEKGNTEIQTMLDRKY